MRKAENQETLIFRGFSGVREVTRTPDLPLRRRSLYPTELRRHSIISSANTEHRYYTRFKLFCKPFVLFRPELEPASWSLLEPEPPLLHLGCTISDSCLHSCRSPAAPAAPCCTFGPSILLPFIPTAYCNALLCIVPFMVLFIVLRIVHASSCSFSSASPPYSFPPAAQGPL